MNSSGRYTRDTGRQIPQDTARGMMSQPYIWAAFRIQRDSKLYLFTLVLPKESSLFLDSMDTGNKCTTISFSPSLSSPAGRLWGMNMFSVLPASLPLTHISLMVSIPSKYRYGVHPSSA